MRYFRFCFRCSSSNPSLFVSPTPIPQGIKNPMLVAASQLRASELLFLLGSRAIETNRLISVLLPTLCKVDPTMCESTVCAFVGCENRAQWNTTSVAPSSSALASPYPRPACSCCKEGAEGA